MKKLEMREMQIVYCDVCGKECTGNYVTFRGGTPDAKDACADWNEALQQRCEDKLREAMVKAARGVALLDPTEKLRRCSLGCLEFGQCKAAMHGVPSECPSGVKEEW